MRTDPLSAFWRQYRHRQSGKGAAGMAYAIYVTVLVLFIYGGPAFMKLAKTLHSPDVVAAVATPGVASALSGVLGLALVVAFVVGTTRGPAVLRPFVAFALVTADVSRRRAFGRAMMRSTIVLALVGGAVSAILLGPLTGSGAVTVSDLVLGIVASVLFGALAAVAWLGGQAATGAAVWAVPGALMLATGAGLVAPAVRLTPWQWAAATWPTGGDAGSALPVVLLAIVAVLGLACTPLLLGALAGPELIEQARRWEGATIAATTGDLSTAMGGFRAAPTAGRRWRVVRGRSFALAALRADLVATLRMPLRALISAVALGAGGWAIVIALDAPGLLRPAMGIVAALALFAGLGPLSDGLRHAVLAVSTPRLFGVSDDAMVLARAWAPLVGGLILAAVGVVAGASSRGVLPWQPLIVVLLLVATLTVIRLDAAAKGTPPLWLTQPIVTPMGDLSVVGTMIWQVDAVLASAIAGIAMLGLVNGSTIAMWVVVAVAGISLIQWRSRMRSL
ncbi:hypothetical protein [Demequina capsici]|uniref:Uncharacterized protein n=1 Tax=Demequina capsici TaxID=3075620 RepID=A0AA96JD08_9MICO|nr:hypothetical protein [Demequina sp. OYTSA14]WNM24194.1 hypothetical protein RN606_12635 [Demequina sp. OYTSA14]